MEPRPKPALIFQQNFSALAQDINFIDRIYVSELSNGLISFNVIVSKTTKGAVRQLLHWFGNIR